MKVSLLKLFGILSTYCLLQACVAELDAALVKDVPFKPSLETCSGDAQFSQLEFDFEEEWMNRYSFWIEDSHAKFGLVAGVGGLNYYRKTAEPFLVRMFAQDGTCIFQAKSYSLQASSIALYVATFNGTGFGPAVRKYFRPVTAPNLPPDLTKIVFVALSVQNQEKSKPSDAHYYFNFAVENGNATLDP